MGVALHIIARTPDEVEPLVKIYKQYFDEIDVAVDKDFRQIEGVNVYPYTWDEEEKELGFPKFDKKRNFLVSKCKQEWYFRLDTDDEIEKPELIKDTVVKASTRGVELVCCYYDYARDDHGHTHAAHNRETIIKNNGNYVWNKAIHENLIPLDGRPKAVIDNNIKIIHHLDQEHALASRDRNLKFLMKEYEKTKDNPDPRTLAYLGRMLYPMGHIKEAKYFLEEHIKKSGWDEDKCISWCMLADIMCDLKKFNDAVACCYEAMRERFDYPDPYLKLHWVYFVMKDWQRAIHWGKIGLGMKRPKTFMLDDPASMTWRPAISMSQCYLMTGDVEESLKYYKILKDTVPNLEWLKKNEAVFADAMEQKKYVENFMWLLNYSKEKDNTKVEGLFDIIPKPMQKHELLIKLRHRYTKPKTYGDKHVAIYCGQAWEEWAAPSVLKGIGGSEEAVVYLSKELTKLGYEVTVFNSCGDMEGTYEGVVYKQFFEFSPMDEYNIVIAWRQNMLKNINAKRKLLWLHDVPQQLIHEQDLDDYDKIIVLSEFHKSLLPDFVPENKIFVSSNGINKKDFSGKTQPKRNPLRLIYTSSYDRGIEHLLEMWDDIVKEVPEAELHLFYGWNTYDAMMEKGYRPREFRDYMNKLMQKPNVFEHGRVGHKKLIEEFYKSGIYVYPSHFEEISCISAMKAQACGCIPIVTNYAALKETVKAGVKVEGQASIGDTNERYKKELIALLKDQSKQTELRKEVEGHRNDFWWEDVAKEWSEDLFTPHRHVYKDFDEYKKVYTTHKPFVPPNFEGSKIIFRERHQYVLDNITKLGSKSYLDAGCSDGALCFKVNKDLNIPCVGIEVDEKCVKFANNLAKVNSVDCKFYRSLIEEYEPEGKVDLVSCLEVIEHVINPKETLKKLESFVKEGGYVVLSTPDKNGYFGTGNFNPQHINNYNEQELRDLIGNDRIVSFDRGAGDLMMVVYKV